MWYKDIYTLYLLPQDFSHDSLSLICQYFYPPDPMTNQPSHHHRPWVYIHSQPRLLPFPHNMKLCPLGGLPLTTGVVVYQKSIFALHPHIKPIYMWTKLAIFLLHQLVTKDWACSPTCELRRDTSTIVPDDMGIWAFDSFSLLVPFGLSYCVLLLDPCDLVTHLLGFDISSTYLFRAQLTLILW